MISGSQVQDHVVQLIDQFCVNRLNMSYADAKKLHADHYQGPGLAVERLSRLHQIDALEYNRLVDDAIPLESIIKPDPELQSLLESIDKTKVKLWLFTNAYVTHGQRVVKVMGVDQYFEGITFSDYAARPLLSKPDPKMFEKAMQEAGAQSSDACYLVGMFLLERLS